MNKYRIEFKPKTDTAMDASLSLMVEVHPAADVEWAILKARLALTTLVSDSRDWLAVKITQTQAG